VPRSDDHLEHLTAKELHDLAVQHARHHLDLKFFWNLLQVVPAAEAAAGEVDEAVSDIQTLRSRVDDVTDAGEGEVAEQLRPFYLDYLREHGVTPGS